MRDRSILPAGGAEQRPQPAMRPGAWRGHTLGQTEAQARTHNLEQSGAGEANRLRLARIGGQRGHLLGQRLPAAALRRVAKSRRRQSRPAPADATPPPIRGRCPVDHRRVIGHGAGGIDIDGGQRGGRLDGEPAARQRDQSAAQAPPPGPLRHRYRQAEIGVMANTIRRQIHRQARRQVGRRHQRVAEAGILASAPTPLVGQSGGDGAQGAEFQIADGTVLQPAPSGVSGAKASL